MDAPRPSDAALVWCPFPDPDSAEVAAQHLLGEGLIACANILGPVQSHFIWNGAPSTASETAVLFKTTAARLSAVIARLGVLHPYDTPAITGWRCDAAHPDTLAWLAASVSPAAARPDAAG